MAFDLGSAVSFRKALESSDISNEDLDNFLDVADQLGKVGVLVSFDQNTVAKPKTPKAKATATRKRKKNPKASEYWQQVRQIAQDEGVSNVVARDIYKTRAENPSMSIKKARKSKKADEYAAGVAKTQKSYWRKVRKIEKDEGVSSSVARRLYRERTA